MNSAFGEGAKAKVAAMSREELEVRLFDAWEALETHEERQERDTKELEERRAVAVLLAAGLDRLSALATDAKPSEYETLFKDYAPWNNIMAHYFGKNKKR